MRIIGILLVSCGVLGVYGPAVAVQTAELRGASVGAPDNDPRAMMLERAAALRAAWAAKSAPIPSTTENPSVISGKVLTPTIDVQKAPGLPTIQLTIASGTVGADGLQISLVSPSGGHTLFSTRCPLIRRSPQRRR